MRPDKMMIAVGIFILFVVVGTGFLFAGRGEDGDGGLFVTYNTSVDDAAFNNISQNIGGLYNTSSGMQDSLVDQEIQAATGWESMVTGGYQAFRLFGEMFGIVGGIVGSIVNIMGIPPIFQQIGMVIMLITVIFIIIYMVFRFQPRND